jgi:hypothetical protein
LILVPCERLVEADTDYCTRGEEAVSAAAAGETAAFAQE